MNERFRFLVRHVLFTLKGGFLVRPLAMALTLGMIGTVLSSSELQNPWLGSWVPAGLFPIRRDHVIAQLILSTIASSVMTVVSIVFAILLMTLTLASSQFSPRIIQSFSRDLVTQWTLGIFLGTFSYCISALPASGTTPAPAPVLTVLGAMLLSLICVAWLLYFIQHISQAISVNFIVDRVAMETEAIIDDLMPEPRKEGTAPEPEQPADPDRAATVLATTSGYVRYIDFGRLGELAKEAALTIYVERRVGHFVPSGVPLLTVNKGERLSEALISALRVCFDLGPTRTLEQDIEFGVLQIVDIGLKAISPAVNDPSTGISCVDQLSRILIRFASREPPAARFYDPPAQLRVSMPWLGLERLVDSAYEQIRLYARSDLAVSLRLMRALHDLAVTVDEPASRAMIRERAQRVFEGCAPNFSESEMTEMRGRLLAFERLV